MIAQFPMRLVIVLKFSEIFKCSKISLSWEKRSYQVGIFYQIHNQSGGINFSLFGFE